MAEFHFVEDYEQHVQALMDQFPLEQAMDLAVGGGWENVQKIELAILKHFGLRDQARIIDLGCGSGRLAQALGKSGLDLNYMGLDIVQSLLDYAGTVSPPSYRFVMNRTLSFPAQAASADMVCAFSVFTHLLPEETYLYLEDAHRVLGPEGRVVFSFLEFTSPAHWMQFQSMVDGLKSGARLPLNTFLAREAIDAFAARLGYTREAFVSGDQTVWDGAPLGQSVAVLRKG